MYCNKCGKHNRDSGIFCDYCGAELPVMFDRPKKEQVAGSESDLLRRGAPVPEEKQKAPAASSDAVIDRTPSKPAPESPALVATILFGPIGLLYVTQLGGIVMLIALSITVLFAIMGIIGSPAFLLLIVVEWIICLVWRSVTLKKRRQATANAASSGDLTRPS